MKEHSRLKEVIDSIENSDLFEIRFKQDYPELTESINSLSFGQKRPNIYLTITNFGHTIRKDQFGRLKSFDYDLRLDNLDIIINQGFNLILYNREGNIIHNFEFHGCCFNDIAEQKLDYNLDNKFKTYIITISYYHIFKILEK